ncbi:MAG: response regulator, partial [Bdellovibrionaceae bacterium]|nr:response regulator [Pseudobdellovibrionaceae bacterium]
MFAYWVMPRGKQMGVDRSNQLKDDRRVLLLIDDEPDMVEVMFTILDSRDTHVLLALNGHEALEMMKQHPVDAVLTDIRMPEMSGVELVQK